MLLTLTIQEQGRLIVTARLLPNQRGPGTVYKVHTETRPAWHSLSEGGLRGSGAPPPSSRQLYNLFMRDIPEISISVWLSNESWKCRWNQCTPKLDACPNQLAILDLIDLNVRIKYRAQINLLQRLVLKRAALIMWIQIDVKLSR